MQYNTRQYIFLGRSRESDTRKIGVSYFPSYTEPEPAGVVSLADFLLQPLYREKVEQIRRCPDKRRRRELKRQLPAVTPAGVFSRRCNDGLIRPSGLVGLDVDGADNPHIGNWEAVKWTISDLPGLWYAGLSASGNGLFLAFCVKCPEQYGRSFDALSQELSGRGIRVDAACRDIARLRGASYDPAPFFNPDAMPYDGYIAPKPLPVNPVRRVEVFSDKTGERVGRLVDRIERQGINMADAYPDWYALGRSLAAAFGESGRGWFHTVSAQSPKYNPRECDAQYDGCLRTCSRTSISTFFWYCKQYGLMAK